MQVAVFLWKLAHILRVLHAVFPDLRQRKKPMLELTFFNASPSESQRSSKIQLQTARSRMYQNEIEKLKALCAACSKLCTIFPVPFPVSFPEFCNFRFFKTFSRCSLFWKDEQKNYGNFVENVLSMFLGLSQISAD